jgi:hypothetical protein
VPRPSRPWFRFYVEAPNDLKLRRLTPAQRWLWVCVLGAARQSREPGVLLIAGNEPWNYRDLADYSGMSVAETKKGMNAIERLGLVDRIDETWCVPQWDARQYEGDFARSGLTPAIRKAVMARDGAACVECDSADDLTIDHVVAVTKGGTNDLENLRVLCRPCNSKKGNRERQQRYRDNARNGAEGVTETNGSAVVTAPETESETDIPSGGARRPRKRAPRPRSPEVSTPTPRGALWVCLIAALGLDASSFTKSEREDVGKTVKELFDLKADPQRLAGFVSWWAKTFPGAELTHRCYRMHWSKYIAAGSGAGDAYFDALEGGAE